MPDKNLDLEAIEILRKHGFGFFKSTIFTKKWHPILNDGQIAKVPKRVEAGEYDEGFDDPVDLILYVGEHLNKSGVPVKLKEQDDLDNAIKGQYIY